MSTFPAVNVSAPVVKPVVVAMASMDSATFFRDVAPGADSPMSGLTSTSIMCVIIFEKLPLRWTIASWFVIMFGRISTAECLQT